VTGDSILPARVPEESAPSQSLTDAADSLTAHATASTVLFVIGSQCSGERSVAEAQLHEQPAFE